MTLSIDDIRTAAGRIAPFVSRPPLISHPELDHRTGASVFVKPECLQRTGSFKIRGAMSRMTLLSEAERARGVVAFSSGNHAQAVAYAARILNCLAVVVMPTDAPAMKIANTRSYGADVILYDRDKEDREAIGERLARDRGLSLIRPFDDWAIMAGQGTAGLEIAQDLQLTNHKPDIALVCCSGGGLCAGMATALTAIFPRIEVYAVEPEGFDDTRRSLLSGVRERNLGQSRSICDALLVDRPGELSFQVNKHRLAGALTVTDTEVRQAIRYAFEWLKLVVEPGGAVALAALLSGKLAVSGKTVAIILSGGNIDGATFAEIISQR